MKIRHLAVLAAALTLSAVALQAAELTLPEAQAQLREAVKQALKARMEKAAPEKAKPAGAAAQLSCHDKARTTEGLLGTLELSTFKLETSRAGAAKPVKETDESKVVDERCGSLKAPLSETLTYEVTARGYWGQDFLQIPKSATAATGKPFEAQLHTCAYDGDWHQDSDAVLTCTLTK